MEEVPMSDTPDQSSLDQSARMREFQSEVDALKVRGGRANPERMWLKVSVVGLVVAIVLEVVAYFGSHGTTNPLTQRDYIIVALLGLTIGVVSTGLFVTFMLTRYFRYWLIRLIYQDRESSDRIIDAMGKR
jgi:hypothetical protein